MKPFEQQNYYELLEVPVSAPPEEIRAAYSRLMELYAPDSIAVYALVDPEQVDTLRARMTEAVEILTDADLRAEYDKGLGVPGQRMAEAAHASGPQPAGAAPEQPAVVRAAEALATAAGALANAAPARAEAAAARPEAGKGTEAPVPTSSQEAPSEASESGRARAGRASVRAAFFQGVSFAYVTSSFQDAQGLGSAVHVPFVPEAAKARSAAEAPVAPSSPARGETAPSAPEPSAASPRAEAPVEAGPPGAEAAGKVVESASAPVAEAVEADPPAEDDEVPVSEAAVEVAPAPAEAAVPAASRRSSRKASPPAPAGPPPLPSQRRTGAEAQASEAGRQAQRPSSGRQLADAQVIAQDSAIATAESALARVAARVRESPPPPPQAQPRPKSLDIPADAEFNGELLRRVREARGQSLQQVADRTRISSRHLENVEADRYADLPAPVYLRGILMNLARELGLDPLRVSRSYLALASEKAGKK
ncbi:MAG TPA: helix-turn-helix domain-containing protein [Myxococcus sp.]|nr:helix-turn-helix domain-containing protein [Myxococcus sp.]